MSATSPVNYKALYQQSLQDLSGQEQLIALLQNRLTDCDKQRQYFHQVTIAQKEVITRQQQQISEQEQRLQLQQQTITAQDLTIEQQQTILAEQDTRIIRQQKELVSAGKELQQLVKVKYELKLLRKWIHGIRSERHLPNTNITAQNAKAGEQLTLDLNAETLATCSVTDRQRINYLRNKKKIIKKHPGRSEFPDDLPCEVVTLDVPDRPANAVLLRVEITRQLVVSPLRFSILETRRPVYMAPVAQTDTCKQLIAPLPPHPIPKCKADISVLVMLAIDKFLYHLPLYRQQQRFRRNGIDLNYNTLSNWLNRTCDILEPLYKLLLRELIISGYMIVDETTYRVLDNEKQKGKKSHLGFLWATCNPIQKIVAFSYQKGRGHKDARHLLQGFKGYLGTDGYGVYKKYGRQPGVTHLQCLAHCRRYFFEARDYDLKRADQALEDFFRPLYVIEESCRERGLDYDQITIERQDLSLPVLNDFHAWLQEQLPQVTPGTPIYKAITYALNRWEQLCVYTTDGMLSIDSNEIERQIRAVTIGRKNYLFAGSHRGGERAAIMYSLLGTCKLQGIDPATWLNDVLHRLPQHPEERLLELLPQFWKPQVVVARDSQSA
jgi:transposase